MKRAELRNIVASVLEIDPNNLLSKTTCADYDKVATFFHESPFSPL